MLGLLFCLCSHVKAAVIQGGVTMSDQVPTGFFGDWKVVSVCTKSTDKELYNSKSVDFWTLSRVGNVIATTLCDMFLQEVFKKGSLESLDRETLMTIQCFFENNLNVSETSRKLFVHRNTLVYRLEKIRKITGLDLREFEHAITFKVALMVKKYLGSKPSKY